MAEADRSAVRARRVQMGRIVGLGDDEVIVRPEQRGRDDEQRTRGTAGNQHIVDAEPRRIFENQLAQPLTAAMLAIKKGEVGDGQAEAAERLVRSEEHTSELQSLMRISYAVFCLKKKNTYTENKQHKYCKQHIPR